MDTANYKNCLQFVAVSLQISSYLFLSHENCSVSVGYPTRIAVYPLLSCGCVRPGLE